MFERTGNIPYGTRMIPREDSLEKHRCIVYMSYSLGSGVQYFTIDACTGSSRVLTETYLLDNFVKEK